MSVESPPNLDLQIKVSKILSRGFVFSIVWMGGIGSLLALFAGLKARKIIKNSNGEIGGMKMAWWCIIVGAFGTIILPSMIAADFLKQKARIQTPPVAVKFHFDYNSLSTDFNSKFDSKYARK